MQATPALPWSPGEGGTINLAEPITYEDIINGKLTFIFAVYEEVGGEFIIAPRNGYLYLQESDDAFYQINEFEGESTSIQLIWSQIQGEYLPHIYNVIVN